MKLVSFIAALLTTTAAFAASSNYTNLEDKSNYVEAVSASNQDGVISLRVVVQSIGKSVAPTAIVADQANGFQCKVIKTLLLESAYDAASKTFTQAYETKVIWTPGNENSGCLVQISHPSLNNTRAIIYMENNEANPSPINEDEY